MVDKLVCDLLQSVTNMYVCMLFICMHVCVCMCVCVCIYVYVYVNMYVCLYIVRNNILLRYILKMWFENKNKFEIFNLKTCDDLYVNIIYVSVN